MISIETQSKYRGLLKEIISKSITTDKVPVLLSGGADSSLVAFSIHELGKQVIGISYELEGTVNPDCLKAERTCSSMGWQFEKVIVKLDDSKRDFLDLIRTYKCQKKTELEILFPMIAMGERIKELGFDYVLSGFEGWIPDTRKFEIKLRNEPEEFWKYVIDETVEKGTLMSSATQKCMSHYDSIGITIQTPLDSTELIQTYSELSYSDCNKPVWKYMLKCLYETEFKKCNLWEDGRSPNLQVGGKVEDYFAPLLSDPEINYRGYLKGNVTQRLSHLTQLWVKDPNPKITEAPTITRFEPYTLGDVNRESSKELFTVVSTFAGGGGSSAGYRLGGGKILFVNEFVDEAVTTYRANYPDTPVEPFDIRAVNKSSAKVRELFAKHGVKKGELDILDGSPPCSTFSTAGKGKDKILKKNVKYSDTRQDRIGMLIHDFVFMCNVMQPKVCVLENVPSIKSSDVFQHALERLRKYNYKVNFSVMTSSNFGVAQRRKRLIVIGVRPDIAKACGIKTEEDVLKLFPQGSIYEPNLNDALHDIEADRRERSLLMSKTRKGFTYEVVKAIPKNPERNIGISDVRPDWTSDFNLVRSSWKQPCPTLTQMGQQANSMGGILYPDEDRQFTIAELKRLMGLPEDFVLTGTFNQKAERLCRMVTPPIYKHLSQSIYENILSKV
jgi:DNA-cytosine methyltransferase